MALSRASVAWGLLLVPVIALGFRDRIAPLDEVTLRFSIAEHPAIVRAQADEKKLVSLSLEIDGKVIRAPAEAISGIEFPRLSSISLLHGRFSIDPERGPVPGVPPSKQPDANVPYQVLYLEYGSPVCGVAGCKYNSARLLFWRAAYRERTIEFWTAKREEALAPSK